MKKKVLVIEDQEDVRENIVELLMLSNYDVESAPNGKEGVKKALESHPDLILCDIMMPEMDGYEVLYILSKNPEIASIPFIFLTAKAEKSDFRKGMNLGADDYITKPFEEMDLLGAIERRLDKYEELAKSSGSIDDFVKSASQYDSVKIDSSERDIKFYKKKEIIYREGDFGSYAYKIKSGKVKTYRINPDGKEFIHKILKEDDFLGENSLMQDSSRTEFAEALEDSELIPVSKEEFDQLVFKNREVAGQFVKLLSKNLTDREHELMEMAYNTVRKRTADSLIKLYDTYNEKEKSTLVSFEIPRADLAGMVGTATESVIRILSEFKKDKWIEIDGSNIAVIEPDKLRQVKY